MWRWAEAAGTTTMSSIGSMNFNNNILLVVYPKGNSYTSSELFVD